jgi:hypothetical protein
MNRLFIISLLLFPIILFGQNDTVSKLEKDWEELSRSIDYEKKLQLDKKFRRGYEPPSLSETYDEELDESEMIYDDINREELYQKRQVMEREGIEGDAPVKKKIKDISKPQKKTEWDQIKLRPRNLNTSDFNMNLDIFKMLLLIIGVVLLAFLIYQLVIKRIKLPDSQKSHKLMRDVDLLNPEEHHEEELHEQLNKYLQNKEYRNALRIQYLMILKELIEKGLIKWKNEKTNYHYQNEINGSPYFEEFHFAVYVFEKAWYGLYDVKQHDYEKVSPRINKLLSKLKNE